ncbi:Methyltransferase-like protein 22 [Geodia barretti]|uniref:Methyltransferase-like protein 22 n=1 Tax=Geodia barretti TaxID=519541 RepID=A0AA35XDB9_GEOBA|nr:Methyltransferase-like protein 22 [Geodia barretti]
MAGITDTFLSDVHIGTFHTLSDQGTLVTRFSFTLPVPQDGSAAKSQAELDEDGDMIVVRRAQHVILIEHAMSTSLEKVGQQVWRGALLMVDYLIGWGNSRLEDSVVLELGAGTGLVSIVAASKAHHVFCTDTGKSVLELCQRNVETNTTAVGGRSGSIAVRELDWRHPFSESSSAGFCWSQEDMDSLSHVSLILASDVVYDNDLTGAFFSCLARLYSLVSKPPTVLVSLEKRLNFSLEDLAVVGPYYQHFTRCLEHSYTTSKGELAFHAQRISTDFPQCSKYDRVKELEIWELNAIISDETI